MRRSNRKKEVIEIIDNESSNDDNKIEEINHISSSSSSNQIQNEKNNFINLLNISSNEDPLKILDAFEVELKLINQKFYQLKKVFIKIYKTKQKNKKSSLININQSPSENKNIGSKKSEESLNQKKSSSNQEISSSFTECHQNNNFKEQFFDYKQFPKKKEKILNEYEKKSDIYKNNNKEKDWIFKEKKEENLNSSIKENISLMENEQKKISNIPIEHTADSLEDLYNDEINTTTIKRNVENKNKITNIDKNKDIKNNEIIDLSDNEEDENILGKKRKKSDEKSLEID